MVIGNKSKSFGKLAAPADSTRAALLRSEAAMSQCVNSVLFRYSSSLEKKREVPLQSGSIWDLDPNFQKRIRKNSNSEDTSSKLRLRLQFSSPKYPNNRVHAKEVSYGDENKQSCFQNNMQSDSYLDELFPDLPPVRLPANSMSNSLGSERHEKRHVTVPLKAKMSYDSIPPSFTHTKEWSRRRPRPTYAKHKPSFEEWSRQRFQEPKPQKVIPISDDEASADSTECPPAPFERNKLHHLENNYFYGILEDDSNNEDASESDTIPDDESLESAETEEPQYKVLSSVLHYLKQAGLILSVPSTFYGTNKNPSGTRVLSSKRFNVGSLKQTLLNRRHFYIKPDGFLTLKVSKDSQKEELVLLGMKILEIRNIFPEVYRFIAAANFQGIAVPFSCSAITVVFRYAFQLTYRITDWEVAMEVYKLACVLELPVLKDDVKMYFTYNPISTADVMKASALADDLSFREMLDKVLVSGVNQPSSEKGVFSFVDKSCTLSYSLYAEPKEFNSLNIPHVYYKSNGDLAMKKNSDVTNTLEIEAVKTCKKIAGLELEFVLDSNDSGKKVQIYCEVQQGRKMVLESEKLIILQPLLPFMFDEKMSVGSEKLTIQMIVEDIKSSYCFYVEKLVVKDDYLKVNLKSNKKNSDKKALYFISKVLYC